MTNEENDIQAILSFNMTTYQEIYRLINCQQKLDNYTNCQTICFDRAGLTESQCIDQCKPFLDAQINCIKHNSNALINDLFRNCNRNCLPFEWIYSLVVCLPIIVALTVTVIICSRSTLKKKKHQQNYTQKTKIITNYQSSLHSSQLDDIVQQQKSDFQIIDIKNRRYLQQKAKHIKSLEQHESVVTSRQQRYKQQLDMKELARQSSNPTKLTKTKREKLRDKISRRNSANSSRSEDQQNDKQ